MNSAPMMPSTLTPLPPLHRKVPRISKRQSRQLRNEHHILWTGCLGWLFECDSPALGSRRDSWIGCRTIDWNLVRCSDSTLVSIHRMEFVSILAIRRTRRSNLLTMDRRIMAIFFAWPHSLLLMPAVQRKIKQRIPAGLIGCIHCLATCVSLLLLFRYWSSSSWTLWDLKGWGEQGMLFFFYASWLALFYSLYLTGLGYQTGLTPWFYWVIRKAPPRRQFVESGAFRWMRHPVYMSFLGLIWFTPRMTLDHLILTLVWTAYIYVGSYLKDRRMTLFLGDVYRDYARRVTGFPLIGFGPWAKLR